MKKRGTWLSCKGGCLAHFLVTDCKSFCHFNVQTSKPRYFLRGLGVEDGLLSNPVARGVASQWCWDVSSGDIAGIPASCRLGDGGGQWRLKQGRCGGVGWGASRLVSSHRLIYCPAAFEVGPGRDSFGLGASLWSAVPYYNPGEARRRRPQDAGSCLSCLKPP